MYVALSCVCANFPALFIDIVAQKSCGKFQKLQLQANQWNRILPTKAAHSWTHFCCSLVQGMWTEQLQLASMVWMSQRLPKLKCEWNKCKVEDQGRRNSSVMAPEQNWTSLNTPKVQCCLHTQFTCEMSGQFVSRFWRNHLDAKEPHFFLGTSMKSLNGSM